MVLNLYLEIHGSKNDEINFGVFYNSISVVWHGFMSCLNNFSMQMYLIHVLLISRKCIVIKI